MHPCFRTSRPASSVTRRAAYLAAALLLAVIVGTTSAAADSPQPTSVQPATTPASTTLLSKPAVGRSDARSPASVVTTTTVTDPDDTNGRFDISSVSHVVSEADTHHVWLSYTVRTYPSWVDLRLDRRYRTFVLELNRDGRPGSEFNVRIAKADGHIVADLVSNATRRVIQRVRVNRADDHSVTISGPRNVLGARSYFWTSNFHVASPRTLCGQQDGYPVICQDSVPKAGWIRMNRPAWPVRSR